MKLLLVDDDNILSYELSQYLNSHGYIADRASSSAEASEFLKDIAYDLVLLNTRLPDADGIKFCQTLRSQGIKSLIVLIATNEGGNSISALNSGADDYIKRPFGLEELEARIKALLRRNREIQHQVICWRDLRLDLSTSQIMVQERSLLLNIKEKNLLALLFQNDQRIHSQPSLLKYLWPLDDDLPGEEAVRTLIRRLRKKLEAIDAGGMIETVYGLGYRLNLDRAAELNTAPSSPANPAQIDSALKDVRLLVLDDDQLILKLLQRMIQPWGIQVDTINQADQLLASLDRTMPDLLILDLNLPDGNGIELCQMLRANSKWSKLSIIILTSQRDSETIRQVFDAGADDFVSKPIVPPEFMARLLNRIERQRSSQDRLGRDPLTGLYNQSGGYDRLAKQMQNESQFCLIVIQIDHLTRLAAEYGHDVRDRWLILFTTTLKQQMPDAVISRWHGGEFVVGATKGQWLPTTQRVLQNVRVSPMGDNPVVVRVGLAERLKPTTTLADLFQQALIHGGPESEESVG